MTWPVSLPSVQYLVDDGSVESGQQRHPLPQGLGEVDLASHRGCRQLRDLALATCPRGQQVDGLVLQQGGVHVHHHQPHGPAVQAAALYRDVDAEMRRLLGQRGPQPGRIGAGYVELDAGHRATGQPPDPVDVGAVRRHPAGYGGNH